MFICWSTTSPKHWGSKLMNSLKGLFSRMIQKKEYASIKKALWNGAPLSMIRQYFEGQWERGKLHGQGLQFFPMGDCYEGAFISGQKNGRGTYRWVDGDVYVGEWKDGNMDGQGTMTSASGTRYTGTWENNHPNGQGKETDPHQTQEGIFKNGRLWTGTSTINIAAGVYIFRYQDGVQYKTCYDHLRLCWCYLC